MSSGNGKMNTRGAEFEAIVGQLPGQLTLGLIDPALVMAVEWLKYDGVRRHAPGCQCRRCLRFRGIARDAARVSDCKCGWCPACWAAGEIRKGRL